MRPQNSFDLAAYIGSIEGRLASAESFNLNLRGQVLALQKERRALKQKLRKKEKAVTCTCPKQTDQSGHVIRAYLDTKCPVHGERTAPHCETCKCYELRLSASLAEKGRENGR